MVAAVARVMGALVRLLVGLLSNGRRYGHVSANVGKASVFLARAITWPHF